MAYVRKKVPAAEAQEGLSARGCEASPELIAKSRRSTEVPWHTFLFADVCGFTEYTRRHGDELAARLALAFHRRVCEFADDEGCEVVKSIGDAVMVRADRCHDALRLGARVIALTLDGDLPIRVGVDVSPAVEHAGDWYGSTVNTAARVTDAASPGELLVTERIRAVIAERDAVGLVARAAGQLKGLPTMRLYARLHEPPRPRDELRAEDVRCLQESGQGGRRRFGSYATHGLPLQL